ncbi:tetratricopeptide repeat protein [Bowmanella dokdonensis]|uniref:Tetratricopeptide repeat protein n=1 Tax=Bowmanella dokdonensis TaxID=751969 RepID=A0A939IQ12_9ALTE|nr:tetratricopeptide repeat protein [Bowmanella dokdonensis]MBN7824132.1 tetratricopeptide repeat protein [Bowmanella dokdonensis]
MTIVSKEGLQTWRVLLALGFLFCLTACLSTPDQPSRTQASLALPLESDGFPHPGHIQSTEELFSLSREQSAHFLNYFHAPEQQPLAPHRRLYRYLETVLWGFNFRGDTLTASEALTQNAGNCMSLAILTTALARLVDLELDYQMVNSIPIYQMEDKLLLLSRHVRTYLYDPGYLPGEDMLVLRRPGIIVDYFPNSGNHLGERVSEADFFAMYYQNMAARAMVEGDLPKAYWLIREALIYSPKNSESLNTLAVIYRQAGQDDRAERVYRYALEESGKSLNVLDNYRHLLLRQGRVDEAEALANQLTNSEDTNPYSWMKMANEAYRQGHFGHAIQFYNQAIELAPYLDQGYFGLAKTYYQRGDTIRSARALEQAMAKSYQQETRQLYFAKLQTLQAIENGSGDN